MDFEVQDAAGTVREWTYDPKAEVPAWVARKFRSLTPGILTSFWGDAFPGDRITVNARGEYAIIKPAASPPPAPMAQAPTGAAPGGATFELPMRSEAVRELLGLGKSRMSAIKKGMGITGARFIFLSSFLEFLRKNPSFTYKDAYPRERESCGRVRDGEGGAR